MSQVTEREGRTDATRVSRKQDKSERPVSKASLEVHLNDEFEDIADMLVSNPDSPWKFRLNDVNDPPRDLVNRKPWKRASMDDLHPDAQVYFVSEKVANYGDCLLINGQVLWKVEMEDWIEQQKKYIKGSYLNMEETLSKEITKGTTGGFLQMDDIRARAGKGK